MLRKVPFTSSPLADAWRSCRSAFAGAIVFSGFINVLALTSSMYMLQLYDHVIPSHSVPTLVGLSVLMLIFYVAYGLLDVIRSRIMSRIGLRFDRALRDRAFAAVAQLPIRARPSGDGLQPIRDLDQIRNFMSGAGPTALFDLPWLPLYMALVYLLHPWLGLLTLGGAVVLVALTAVTEMRSRHAVQDASGKASARLAFGEATRQNAEVIRALGMGQRFGVKWSALTESYLLDHIASSDVATTYGNLSKVLRMILQSAVLGLGAYLVIYGQASAGVMVSASILAARALAPVEIAIANWRGFLSARQSAGRLALLFNALPDHPEVMTLPRPQKSISVEGLWVAAPGQQQPIVQNVNFSLNAGDGLAIIGPSASGKSTLTRVLVGAWRPLRGDIRLDGAALEQWPPEMLGTHIGYLPQDIELFDGSVAENISRFDKEAGSVAIISAAKKAGVHEMVLRLPAGYDTRIGGGGSQLSAGQRQRLALARALYGDPFLVVLDEPNSNLDAEGDAALMGALRSVRERGGIAIVIAHRPAVMAGLDRVLVMGAGLMQAFGPRDEVLRKAPVPAPAPLAAAQAAPLANGHYKVISKGRFGPVAGP